MSRKGCIKSSGPASSACCFSCHLRSLGKDPHISFLPSMKHLCSGVLQDCFLLSAAQASEELCWPAGSGILWKNWLQYKVDTKLSGANPVFAMGYLRQLLNLCMPYSSSSKLTACRGLLRLTSLQGCKVLSGSQRNTKRVLWGRGYPPVLHEDIGVFRVSGIWTQVFDALLNSKEILKLEGCLSSFFSLWELLLSPCSGLLCRFSSVRNLFASVVAWCQDCLVTSVD